MLRNLKTKDIFKMSKILKKMNLKMDDVKGKEQEQVGAEMILKIIENIHMAEDEVNIFLADISGMTKEEFEDLDIDKFFEIIKEFKNMPMVGSFLSRANQLKK